MKPRKPPLLNSVGKRECSGSKSNQPQKRNKETVKSLRADMVVIKNAITALSAAALNRSQTDTRPVEPHHETQTSSHGKAVVEIPDDGDLTKIIVM